MAPRWAIGEPVVGIDRCCAQLRASTAVCGVPAEVHLLAVAPDETGRWVAMSFCSTHAATARALVTLVAEHVWRRAGSACGLPGSAWVHASNRCVAPVDDAERAALAEPREAVAA